MRRISADPGIYTVIGASADTIVARLLATDPGAYVITGLTATLVSSLDVPSATLYAVEIVVMSDAREIVVLEEPRNIVVN